MQRDIPAPIYGWFSKGAPDLTRASEQLEEFN
jgi:hypothetical protein